MSYIAYFDLPFLICVAIKIAVLLKERSTLSTLATDSSRQLDIFWHDGDPLGVNSAQVGILEESNKVSF